MLLVLSPKQQSVSDDDDAWAREYAEYCAEKEQETARIMAAEPQHQSRVVVPGAVKEEEEESWEVQYAAHCAEKETRLRQNDQEKPHRPW